jgi:hypothetical protein
MRFAAAVKTKKTGYAKRSAVMDKKETAPLVGGSIVQ